MAGLEQDAQSMEQLASDLVAFVGRRLDAMPSAPSAAGKAGVAASALVSVAMAFLREAGWPAPKAHELLNAIAGLVAEDLA